MTTHLSNLETVGTADWETSVDSFSRCRSAVVSRLRAEGSYQRAPFLVRLGPLQGRGIWAACGRLKGPGARRLTKPVLPSQPRHPCGDPEALCPDCVRALPLSDCHMVR